MSVSLSSELFAIFQILCSSASPGLSLFLLHKFWCLMSHKWPQNNSETVILLKRLIKVVSCLLFFCGTKSKFFFIEVASSFQQSKTKNNHSELTVIVSNYCWCSSKVNCCFASFWCALFVNYKNQERKNIIHTKLSWTTFIDLKDLHKDAKPKAKPLFGCCEQTKCDILKCFAADKTLLKCILDVKSGFDIVNWVRRFNLKSDCLSIQSCHKNLCLLFGKRLWCSCSFVLFVFVFWVAMKLKNKIQNGKIVFCWTHFFVFVFVLFMLSLMRK